MEEEATSMPADEAVSAVTESDILLAAVEPPVKMTEVGADALNDTEILIEPLATQNGEIELEEKEVVEPLSASIDTVDIESKMIQINEAADDLAVEISTDDDFNTSEPIAEEEEEEEEDEADALDHNDVEIQSSNSSASSIEYEVEEEDDDTETTMDKLPTADVAQAIEIDDDDDDEELKTHHDKYDDEFDEDSENQSYSDDRSSVEALPDDDEDEEIEMKSIAISATIPTFRLTSRTLEKTTKRGVIKNKKAKTLAQRLIAKSIKCLCRKMHDSRNRRATSQVTFEQLPQPLAIKQAVPKCSPAAMTKEALLPQNPPQVQAKKSIKPPIHIVEEIAMIVDSDDEIETHVNGVTQLPPIKNEPEPMVPAPNDVALQTPAIVEVMELKMSSPSSVKVCELEEVTLVQSQLQTAPIIVAKDIPASVEPVAVAMQTLPEPTKIAEPSAETVLAASVPFPEIVPDVPSTQIASVEPAVLAIASNEKSVDERLTGRSTVKRTHSVSSEEMPPSKRFHAELEDITEYINKTSSHNDDELSSQIAQLEADLKNLDDLAKAKENEWNQILHMKKVKEEVILRLKRRQTINGIMSTKIGGDEGEFSIFDTQSPSLIKRTSKEPQQSLLQHSDSTPNSTLNSILMVPLVSSTPGSMSGNAGSSTAQSILNRVNMKSSDLAKQKAHTDKIHRNILPKPGHPSAHQSSSSSSSPILNNYMITASKAAATAAALTHDAPSVPKGDKLDSNQRLQLQMQHQAFMNAVMMNGGASSAAGSMQNTPIGRQGPIKDVKSIIDDFRQKHPESVPRRGRRLKGTLDIINAAQPTDDDGPTVSSSRRFRSTYPVYYDDAGRDSTRHQRRLASTSPNNHRDFPDLSSFFNRIEANLRPPSNGSSHSNSNVIPASGNAALLNELIEYAKYAQNNGLALTAAASPGRSSVDIQHTSTPIGKAPPGYPEVTLHPVSSQPESAGPANNNTQASAAGLHNNSLLHGILTKVCDTNPRPASGYTSFAPTLARLLTAPERITPLAAAIYQNHSAGSHQQAGTGRTPPPSTSLKSEITITPVEVKPQTLLQQQLQRQRDSRSFLSNVDDEADDSVDRLVIDEGENHDNSANLTAVAAKTAQEDTPECQGCKRREAQFMCAGCGNQWYCSRNCQVTAWDEHSEVCTG